MERVGKKGHESKKIVPQHPNIRPDEQSFRRVEQPPTTSRRPQETVSLAAARGVAGRLFSWLPFFDGEIKLYIKLLRHAVGTLSPKKTKKAATAT